MNILLIAGLWLDGSAWDKVAPPLRGHGHDAVPITLPGQGAPSPTATLADQHATVLAAIDATGGDVVVVGHSAASTLAWMAADARPGRVVRVVMIGGFPSGDGHPYFGDAFPLVDGVMPFPGWEPFDAADSADLDDRQREAIASAAIPVPESVTMGIVHLSDQRRYEVPVTIVCPEFSATQAREWLQGGEIPELDRVARVDYVEIDSGHWPMFTRPIELAGLLAAATDSTPDAR